jgi:hypothetical protein
MHDIFNLTRKPLKARKTTPERHVPACNILHGHVSFQKLELQRKNKVSGSSDWLHTGRNAFRKIHWDGRSSRTAQETE